MKDTKRSEWLFRQPDGNFYTKEQIDFMRKNRFDPLKEIKRLSIIILKGLEFFFILWMIVVGYVCGVISLYLWYGKELLTFFLVNKIIFTSCFILLIFFLIIYYSTKVMLYINNISENNRNKFKQEILREIQNGRTNKCK